MRVIVVGTGILGMSLSYHLVKSDASVLAVDAARPGGLASAATFACINYFNYWQEPYFSLRRNAIDHARALADTIGAEHALRLPGTLRWSENPAGWDAMDRSIKQLKTHGIEVEYFTPSYVTRQLEPDLDLTGITRDLVRVPDEGWMDGVPFVGRLLAAAQSTGKFEWVRRKVTACFADDRGARVITEEGAIQGDVLVLAAGIGTSELAASLGANVPVKQDASPMAVSDYLPAKIQHTIYAGHLHIRPDGAGRVMIGRHGGDFPNGLPPADEAALLIKQAARRVPSLGLNSTHAVLMGTRPVPQDGYPVVGWLPGHTRAYVATCHSGMTLGPWLGKLGAQEILTASADQLAPYRPERFLSAAA